jgi:thiamine-phosphate pyrophosphorylase
VTICLVTDRRRLAPGASLDAARAAIAAQVHDAVHAGIDLVQVRERDLEARHLAALVLDVLAAAHGSQTRVVVNDRLDVALACGADGVHLRADSIAVADARRIAPPGFLVGRSVHAVADLPAATGADYLIAGTVFSSPSKSGPHTLLGTDGLRRITAAAHVPVLAIGGIAEDRLDELAAAGAAGIAAIGLFTGAGSGALQNLVARARLRFDRVRRGP